MILGYRLCFQSGGFGNVCAAVAKSKSRVRQKLFSNGESLIYEAALFYSRDMLNISMTFFLTCPPRR